MNAIIPINSSSMGLVPASMTEAMKLAEMMASSKLVPVALQKSAADCLMVIQQAVRWQMDPFAVAQECSVIQGRLMHSGKLVAAVVNARGNLIERLSYTYAGQNGNRTITVSGRLAGEASPRTVTVKLSDAKTSAKVWQSQPDQQLMYHGCRVWARRHTPELMLGVWSPEEFDDGNRAAPRDITPAAVSGPMQGDGEVLVEATADDFQQDGEVISADQEAAIERLLAETKLDAAVFLKFFNIKTISDLPVADYWRAVKKLELRRAGT